MTRPPGRPRVLMLTKFLPDGPPSGGMMRTTALHAALCSRFDVRILGYDERGPSRPRSRRSSLVNALLTRRAYQVARWDTRWLRERVRTELAQFRPDVVHVDHLQLAPYAMDLPHTKVLDMHNVESVFAAGVADATSGPTAWLARRDARLLAHVERRAAERFPVVIVSSDREAARAPGSPAVLPNGIRPDREPLDVTPDPDVVVFVGLFSWLPNIDGAEWLVREVLPLLPPSMRIQLVGRDPHKRVRDLAGPRVEVTGEVPDVWPHVCGAGVVLAPLLSTGGTRLKILEGLLAARPVVATPLAAEGLEDLQDSGLVLAASPSDFAAEVIALARDQENAGVLGRAGRAAVTERYDWDRIGRRLLDDVYRDRLGLG